MRTEQWSGRGFDAVDDPRLELRRAAAEAQRALTAGEKTSVDADREVPDADEATERRDLVGSGASARDGK
jgi:hypothetical protein